MKNSVKLFAVILLIAFTTQSYAQKFGVKAGLNLANMSIKDMPLDTKMNIGFNVGATAEFAFSDMLSFETGLMLNTKGFKISEEGFDLKANIFYLDIPLTIKAGFDVGGAKIFALAGPYVGYALSGKIKTEILGESDTEDIEFGEDGEFKRLDYGILVGAGVEFGKISVGANYGLGLANIANDGDSKNRVISISVGYKF